MGRLGLSLGLPLRGHQMKAGSVAQVSTAVLDSASKTAGVTLSGTGSNTATMTAGSVQHVYTVKGPSTGKYWMEVTATAVGSGDFAIGLHDSAGSPNIQDTAGWIEFVHNGYWTNGIAAAGFGGPTWAAGTTVTIAIDADANKVWLATGAGWFSGDPGASGVGTTVFDVGKFYLGIQTNGGTATVNTGETAFVRSMATGFAALKDAA